MTVERVVRGIAGLFVLLSLALAHWVSPYWLFFTAFVGLNLLQSALTDWCPAMTILRRLGLKGAGGGCCCPSTGSGPRPRAESRGGHADEQQPAAKA